MARIMFVLAVLVMALFAWRYTIVRDKSAERLARVLQLDPRKIEPSTRALVLLDTLPDLQSADREVAMQRLRDTLGAIPRRIVEHQPAVPVEAIRFPATGRTALWYGKAANGIIIEILSERGRTITSRREAASCSTFLNDAGTLFFKNEGLLIDVVMSRDGEYLNYLEDGTLAIWDVRDFANYSIAARPLFSAELPNATTRLSCGRPEQICGVDSPGRVTIIDLKKGKVLQSIALEKSANVHMSPSGRFVGVLEPRGAAMRVHATRQDAKIRIDASSHAFEAFAFSADEKSVVAVDHGGMLHSYDIATGKTKTRSAVMHNEQWKGRVSLETVGDGRFIMWSADKVRLLSADLSTVAARFDGGGDVVMVKTNPRGDRLAIVRRNALLTLWDIATNPAPPASEAELKAEACDRIGHPLTPAEWTTYFPHRPYFPSCR